MPNPCHFQETERQRSPLNRRYVPEYLRPRRMVGQLLGAGARVDHVDESGKCALMTVGRDVEVVRLMVAAGADVSRKDPGGRSVLMHCIERQVGDVMDVVGYEHMRLSADEREGYWARTSVRESWKEHLEVVQELLSSHSPGSAGQFSDAAQVSPYTTPPYTIHPTPYTLHPTPYTLHPTPYTLHPTPYTLHPLPFSFSFSASATLQNAAQVSAGADVRGAPVFLASLQGYLQLQTHLAPQGFPSGGDPHPALHGCWAVQQAILAAAADSVDATPCGMAGVTLHEDAKGDTALHLACQA